MSERDTKIKIVTQADNTGTKSARNAMGQFVKSTDQAGAAATRTGKKAKVAGDEMASAAHRPHRALNNMISIWRRLRRVMLGVGAALAATIREAVTFNIQMARAWTMMDGGIKQFSSMRREIIGLSKDLGLAKSELAGGLYQALSAGVPKDNVISFLSKAGKVAVADGSSVSTAVDGITTILNAFKIESKDTGRVVDLMFQTVAKGKTTFGELAQQISVAAPLAATLGVKIEDVLAAVATLTKQGTPTAVAMTQIRAAMLSTNNVLGDGWTNTYNLADAFQAVSDKAGGSQNKLRMLVGSIEALNGILGLSGQNAKVAKADIDAMASSAGALDSAFGKVDQFRHWHKLWQNIRAIATSLGTALDETLQPAVERVTAKLSEWEGKTQFFDKLKTKLTAMREDVEGLWTAVTDQGKGAEVFSALKGIFVGGIRMGVEKAVMWMAEQMPAMGMALGTAAKDAMSGGARRRAIFELETQGKVSPAAAAVDRIPGAKVFNSRREALYKKEMNRQSRLEGSALSAGMTGTGESQYEGSKARLGAIADGGKKRNVSTAFEEQVLAEQEAVKTRNEDLLATEKARVQKEIDEAKTAKYALAEHIEQGAPRDEKGRIDSSKYISYQQETRTLQKSLYKERDEAQAAVAAFNQLSAANLQIMQLLVQQIEKTKADIARIKAQQDNLEI